MSKYRNSALAGAAFLIRFSGTPAWSESFASSKAMSEASSQASSQASTQASSEAQLHLITRYGYQTYNPWPPAHSWPLNAAGYPDNFATTGYQTYQS
jgi:hypothetical protein